MKSDFNSLNGKALGERIGRILKSLSRKQIKGKKVGRTFLASYLGMSLDELRELELSNSFPTPDLIKKISDFCCEKLKINVTYDAICGILSRDFKEFEINIQGPQVLGYSEIDKKQLFRIYLEINQALSEDSEKE